MPDLDEQNRLPVLAVATYDEAIAIETLMTLKYGSWHGTILRLKRYLVSTYPKSKNIGNLFHEYCERIWRAAIDLLAPVTSIRDPTAARGRFNENPFRLNVTALEPAEVDESGDHEQQNVIHLPEYMNLDSDDTT